MVSLHEPSTGGWATLSRSLPGLFGCLIVLLGCGGERLAEPGTGQTTTPAGEPSRPKAATPAVAETGRSSPRPSAISEGLTDPGLGRHSDSRPEPPRFQDVAPDRGLHFTYDNGAGRQLMTEGTGGGAGWLDIDRDGQWDLFLVQGGDPIVPGDTPLSDALYRNHAGRFQDVTTLAGIRDAAFGQGVSVGDFDGDGFDDVFVTNVGRDRLLRNLGDGTFEDVSNVLSGDTGGWSSSAAWGDVDRDGDLDLYVCRYCDFDPRHPQKCTSVSGKPAMCQPRQVAAVPDVLFVNQGDGRFVEEAASRGLVGREGRGLGVAIADFDNDGWADVYVGNDATPNYLFMNRQDGHFRNDAVALGISVLRNGTAQGSMGLGIGDYDRNGLLDVFVTNFEGEGNGLYENQGPLGFQEVSGRSGLIPPTLPMVGWGTVMADFNRDGHDELFVANGHIADGRNQQGDLEQTSQVFSFGGSRWFDQSKLCGPYFSERWLGRGAAAADFDNDGDLDLAVVHQNKPMSLLENVAATGHWLQVELVGRTNNRRGIGARVTVRSGQQTLMQELFGGGSYCSASRPQLNFGLGSADVPVSVEVRWPDGRLQRLDQVSVDQRLKIVEDWPGEPEA